MTRWTSSLGALAALAVFLNSFCSADEPVSLIGEWTAISMEARGKAQDKINYGGMRWTFAKDTLQVRPGRSTPAGIAGKPPLKCSYVRDDTQSPRHFNWTMGEGEKQKTVNAIYELKDDVLRICFAKGGEERPQSFHTKGTEYAVYQFKRSSVK